MFSHNNVLFILANSIIFQRLQKKDSIVQYLDPVFVVFELCEKMDLGKISYWQPIQARFCQTLFSVSRLEQIPFLAVSNRYYEEFTSVFQSKPTIFSLVERVFL